MKKTKKKKACIASFALLCGILIFQLLPQTIYASKLSNGWYISTHLGQKNIDKTESDTPAFYKAKIVNGKFILYGGIAKQNQSDYTLSKFKGYQKFTFPLSSGCQIGTYLDGTNWEQFDPDTFNGIFNKTSNIRNRTLKFQIKKNKIVKILIM